MRMIGGVLHDELARMVLSLKPQSPVLLGRGKKLAKTKMAKSIYDAGWYQLKNQIQYKAIARGVIFEVVDEAYTTQACSCCGAISHSSPKGRAGLGIREWICVECGELHDRDVNAAKNILAAGHRRLEGGIHVL